MEPDLNAVIEGMSSLNVDNHTGARTGVNFFRPTGRWTAHLRVPEENKTKQLYIGSFATSTEAVRAYDMASLKHFGRAAVLNGKLSDYVDDIRKMHRFTRKRYIALLRKQSKPITVEGKSTVGGTSKSTQHENSIPVTGQELTPVSSMSNSLPESGGATFLGVKPLRRTWIPAWIATLRMPHERYPDQIKEVFIGVFVTAAEAMRAYDKASLKHFGADAVLNYEQTNYLDDIKEMDGLTNQQYIRLLRKQAKKSRKSKYRYFTPRSRLPSKDKNMNTLSRERPT